METLKMTLHILDSLECEYICNIKCWNDKMEYKLILYEMFHKHETSLNVLWSFSSEVSIINI